MGKKQGKSILYLNKEINYQNGFEIELHPKEEFTWIETSVDGYFELTLLGE